MKHFAMATLFAVLATTFATGAALAQAVAPDAAAAVPADALDFGPLLQFGADYVVAAVGAVLLFVFHRFVAPVLGEQLSETARKGLDDIARRGIRLAADRLAVSDRLGAIQVKNDLIREAGSYVIASAPGWVAKFNLGPDRIEDMIRARFSEEVAKIEAEAAPQMLAGTIEDTAPAAQAG